jgi:hypothetical protein
MPPLVHRLGGVAKVQVARLLRRPVPNEQVASATAVEANRRAFLKCLVMKEVVGTLRARFLLGDFVAYIHEWPTARFDVGITSGVLYHTPEPVELLAPLARACDRLHLGTHHYDPELVEQRPEVAARFRAADTRSVEGFMHTLHQHCYKAARFTPGFCGSPCWMTRGDIIGALRHFGHERIEIGLEEPDHRHGPALGHVSARESAAAS